MRLAMTRHMTKSQRLHRILVLGGFSLVASVAPVACGGMTDGRGDNNALSTATDFGDAGLGDAFPHEGEDVWVAPPSFPHEGARDAGTTFPHEGMDVNAPPPDAGSAPDPDDASPESDR